MALCASGVLQVVLSLVRRALPHLADYPTESEVVLARCGARGGTPMKRQVLFERDCIHRDTGADGDSYNGMFFIQALQRLQSDDAVKMAGKVSPFYWVDAPRVLVWLCKQCATELSLIDSPRAVIQSARR